jgi:ABC-2 type transport system ATP-binding protein
MTELAIEASQLTRRFGSYTAVDRLDLRIPKGTIYGFLGPNGSGKSTSIRLLTGLLTPDSGSIDILGLKLPREAEKLRHRIGYMTQKFSLFGDLTIQENLQFMARIYGLSHRELQPRINELLLRYDLGDKRKQLADTLSGGQKQRLALAAATIHRPELLFLDEPTSAVDPVSTHYMDEAERCHYLAILETGVKRADDTPQNLMTAMAANVVEIRGPQLRHLKQQLLLTPQVMSVAQQGVQLRVLVSKQVSDPLAWLHAHCPAPLAPYQLALVRPSLEDVFVTCTGAR